MENKDKIEVICLEFLEQSFIDLKNDIKRAINCGALDISGWDEKQNPMVIPKIILASILEKEAKHYYAKGCSFEKQVKKEIKNLKYFL